jgi:hypothetical protein
VRGALARSRVWIAPRFPTPSQESTSLRVFVTGFCHSANPVTGLRRLPRHDGSHRQRGFVALGGWALRISFARRNS